MHVPVWSLLRVMISILSLFVSVSRESIYLMQFLTLLDRIEVGLVQSFVWLPRKWWKGEKENIE